MLQLPPPHTFAFDGKMTFWRKSEGPKGPRASLELAQRKEFLLVSQPSVDTRPHCVSTSPDWLDVAEASRWKRLSSQAAIQLVQKWARSSSPRSRISRANSWSCSVVKLSRSRSANNKAVRFVLSNSGGANVFGMPNLNFGQV